MDLALGLEGLVSKASLGRCGRGSPKEHGLDEYYIPLRFTLA